MIIQYANDSSDLDSATKKNPLCHFLTMKHSLLGSYTNKSKSDIPKTFEDLKANEWVHGWVRKILPTGVLVEIPHGLVGFSSNQDTNFMSELKSSNYNGLSVGYSILVKINKLFAEKKQFLTHIRTRHSLLNYQANDVNFMIGLYKSLIVNTARIFENLEPASEKINGSLPKGSKELWQSALKVKVGSVVQVAIKRFSKPTKQIECVFLEEDGFDSSISGIAYAIDNEENICEGAKMDALVLGFDPLAKTFCLTIDKKSIKTYRKNFEKDARSHLSCRPDQIVKSEILYVSQWFGIIGLKAHALGRLALMPLFKNDFTQLSTFNATSSGESIKLDSVETKIKQSQLLKVSSSSVANLEDKKVSKEEREFNFYAAGQMGKVCVKLDESDMDYAIVVHDLNDVKRTKKMLLRQLAILNENHTEENGEKRKAENGDDGPVLVKKKLVLDKKGKRKLEETEDNNDYIEIVSDVKKTKVAKSVDEIVDASAAFPWEVNDFDQFNKIVNSLSNAETREEENFQLQSEDLEQNGEKKAKKDKKSFVNDKTLYQVDSIL